MNQPENAIVVAVGYDGCDAALKFAVEEAQRTDSPVHLLQVTSLPDTVEYSGIYASSGMDVDADIERALATARKLAAGTPVAVTGERVEDRSHVSSLVRHADRGRMVVLQHRRLSTPHRIVTGSTTNGVAARAGVPVVSVPEDWSRPSEASVVTVAVQDAPESASLLRAGFEQARARQAPLVILHAWWLASGFDVVVVDDSMRRDWTSRTRSALAPVLADLEAEFPDVEVAVDVQHAPPIEALLDAGQKSVLLVLGRRHHLLPLGTHLGPVARATLNHSACPVLMVPPTPEEHRQTMSTSAVDLLWLPLGAGDNSGLVRWGGRAYEALSARGDHRDRADLYHSALEVHLDGHRYAVEMTPAWGLPNRVDRGVVVTGAVGLAGLGRWRLFRYEIHAWRDGRFRTLPTPLARHSGSAPIERWQSLF